MKLHTACIASLILVFGLFGCSKKSDLTGSWKANMDGDNVMTLNRDGTASMKVDITTLFGRTNENIQGNWKLLDGKRLLLEFQKNGIHTSEINQFEIVDGDLVLARLDNGHTMRYSRVADMDTPPDKPSPSITSGAPNPEQQIKNNLRYLSMAAEQYFLENGVNQVDSTNLIGPNVYIKELKSVAGERYQGIVVKQGESISVKTADGRVFSYKM